MCYSYLLLRKFLDLLYRVLQDDAGVGGIGLAVTAHIRHVQIQAVTRDLLHRILQRQTGIGGVHLAVAVHVARHAVAFRRLNRRHVVHLHHRFGALVTRFGFGMDILKYGIDMLPAMIALIALTQVVQKLRDFVISGGKLDDANVIDNEGLTRKELVKILPACTRSSAIASILGAMPGVGGGVAQFMCYNECRRASKHPEMFGKGSHEGIAAAEASNNAVVGSAMIPLLTLGIPGDGVTALLLGAFILHGIQPGPTMFTKQGVIAYSIILGCLVANVFLYPVGLALTRAVAKIIQVRYTYLAPVIIMFCFAGAFAATGNVKEMVLTAAILIFSYILVLLDISNTPLMLGMILADIMEMNFVTSMMSYDHDYLIFVKRPISCVILIITVVLVISMIKINKKIEALNQAQMEEIKREQEAADQAAAAN